MGEWTIECSQLLLVSLITEPRRGEILWPRAQARGIINHTKRATTGVESAMNRIWARKGSVLYRRRKLKVKERVSHKDP
jgi:hypothetical protein